MRTATVAGWRDYALARGNTAPADAQPDVASQAFVRGEDYIRASYPAQYRAGGEAVDEAIYIAASMEMQTPGFWSRTWTAQDAKVLTKVEGIQWTVIDGGGGMTPRSSLIEGLLARKGAFGVGFMVV